MPKKWEELLAPLIFCRKNISTLEFRRTRRLNESLTNYFVKLTRLWTTGPRSVRSDIAFCLKLPLAPYLVCANYDVSGENHWCASLPDSLLLAYWISDRGTYFKIHIFTILPMLTFWTNSKYFGFPKFKKLVVCTTDDQRTICFGRNFACSGIGSPQPCMTYGPRQANLVLIAYASS